MRSRKAIEKEEALTFLEEHQPLPADDSLTQELLEKYDEVRRYFIANPDVRCIPLFLNSFGNGSGFGVYQLVEDVLEKYPLQEIIPSLYEALKSQYSSVRYWTTQISPAYPQKFSLSH